MTHLSRTTTTFPGARALRRARACARPRAGGPRAAALALAAALGLAGLLAPLDALAAKPRAPSNPASANMPSDPNEPGDNKPPVHNSELGGELMYHLLLGEFDRVRNQPGDAIEIYVDAGRHEKSDQLFLRGVQIALESGSAEKALEVTTAWRQSMPKSSEAVTAQMQLYFALDRVADAAEPLRTLLAMTEGPQRAALISTLPRAAGRAKDKAAVGAQFEKLLAPYLDAPDTRVAARVALGRLRLAENHADAALALALQASDADPHAIYPAWLGLELMAQPGAQPGSGQPGDRSAEGVVRRYLDQPQPDPVIRQALAALLTQQQRIAEAAVQVRLAAEARPQQVMLWLSLGELEIELRHPQQADEALKKALDLALADQAAAAQRAAAPGKAASAAGAAAGSSGAADDDADADDDETATTTTATASVTRKPKPSRIYLLLARSAQLRHDDAATRDWLAKIPPQDADLSVVSLRADLLAKAGQLKEARRLIEAAPAETDDARRLKVLTEVQLLRQARQLADARQVLVAANAAQPDDVELLYEQAMVDEQLDKLDEMEKLLRHVLVLQPDHAQSLNALGYSLADRRQRLPEALQLVTRAHEIAPADPFIVDSLGWVEFRLGHLPEATRWLRQAYTARNDSEIAAHLGEALWAQGERVEAQRIFEEARRRDADNELLRQTIKRLKATP